MFVTITIHRPYPGKESLLVETMQSSAEASKKQPQSGLQKVHVMRDTTTGDLIGLTIWDNEASMIATRDAARANPENSGFEAIQEPIRVMMFEEV